MEPKQIREIISPSWVVPYPAAEAFDLVLEAFKRDIDFTLVEKNLRLNIEERARQLVNATRFIYTRD